MKTLTTATAHTAELLAAVKDVWRGVPTTRGPLPILTNAHLTVANGLLWISMFNFDIRITRLVEVEGDLPTMLVSGVRLKEALAKLNAKERVTLADSDSHLLLTQGTRTVKIAKDDMDEYPELPEFHSAHPVTIKGERLQYAANTVAKLVGRDDMLPVLTGTHFIVEGDTLITESTDRFRAAVAEHAVFNLFPENEIDAIVPNLAVWGTMFDADDTVSIMQHGDTAATRALSFCGRRTKVHVRAIEGQFPKLRMLFPSDPTTTTFVSAPEMLKALDFARIPVLRNEAVQVTFGDNKVTLSGGDDDQQMTDTVQAVVHGDTVETGFNPDFLADILKVFGKVDITVGNTHQHKPSLFTSDAHPDLRIILMPRRRVS